MDSPTLRPLDIRPIQYDGKPFLLIRDPLELSDQQLLLPQPMAAVLAFLDGTYTPEQISVELAQFTGFPIGIHEIGQLINSLDLALLLENERSQAARKRKQRAYRSAAFRKPTLAGVSYPDKPDDFRQYLQNFVNSVKIDRRSSNFAPVSGLVSPHIDFPRGGEVYARTWMAAAEAVRGADLAVVFGTDHYGASPDLTLTRQHYATPLGTLPTAVDIVDALASEMGEQRSFAGELRHLGEHSIELAVAWLHFVRGGEPVELVPVLCGSLQQFIALDTDPDTDPDLQRWMQALREHTTGRRTIAIAAGDLSHVGSAFGGEALDLAAASQVKDTDQALIDLVCAGEAGGFYRSVAATGDRTNVCGLAPIYLALKFLEPASGNPVAYERCPADESGGSLVSICGVTLHSMNGASS